MLVELLGGAAVAGMASLAACRVQMAAGPIDRPDEERKAHARPTPTSGGVGVGAGYAAGLIALSEFGRAVGLERQALSLVWLASALALAFLVVGFVDDNRPLGPRLKFVVFSLLSLVASVTMGVVDALPLGHGAEMRLGLSIGLFGTALWVFTMVNCVNFMDGANGLALGSMALGLAAMGAIAVELEVEGAAAISFCGAGALWGFLFWNYPRGRLFAGDSGALFAGAVAAIVSLILISRAGLSPFIPPIVFMPLLGDALLTLAWRVGRRRKILVGHQEHFYQIAIRSGWSHTQITLVYWAAMAACGVAGVGLARLEDSPAPWLLLAVLASVALVISSVVRRFARARGLDAPTG